MPRWLLALALVGCGRIDIDPILDGSSAPSAGWQLIQTAGSVTPNVSVARLGAHHLVVVAIQLDGSGQITGVTDSSGCNTYVAIPAAHATNVALGDDLQIYYAKDSCPQADTISVASTMGPVHAAVIWEVAGIRTDDPMDTAAALDDQPTTSAPFGPALTTGGDGEFVVAAAMVDNNAPRTHAGNEFTNDQTTNGNGWAHLTDPHAPAGVHQAQWDQTPPGAYCATAAAFRAAP